MWQKDPYQQLSEDVRGPARDRLDSYLACQQNGVGLIAMRPYARGLLLREGAVLDFLEGKEFEHPGGLALTSVQCLSYVLPQPGVSAALPGCANPKELEDALAYFDARENERDFSAIDVNDRGGLRGGASTAITAFPALRESRQVLYSGCWTLQSTTTMPPSILLTGPSRRKLPTAHNVESASSAARSVSMFRPVWNRQSKQSVREPALLPIAEQVDAMSSKARDNLTNTSLIPVRGISRFQAELVSHNAQQFCHRASKIGMVP